MNILRDGVVQPFEKVALGMIFSTRDGETYIKTFNPATDLHAATNLATGKLCVFDDESEVCTVHPHAVLVVNGLQEPAWARQERVRLEDKTTCVNSHRYFIPRDYNAEGGDKSEGVREGPCFIDAMDLRGTFYSSDEVPYTSHLFSIACCKRNMWEEITLQEALALSVHVRDFPK